MRNKVIVELWPPLAPAAAGRRAICTVLARKGCDESYLGRYDQQSVRTCSRSGGLSELGA